MVYACSCLDQRCALTKLAQKPKCIALNINLNLRQTAGLTQNISLKNQKKAKIQHFL